MFVTPTVKQLAQTARAAFRAEMPGTDPWLWPSVLHVVAKVFAGVTWSLYGRLRQIDRMRFVTTSVGQELDLHGGEWGEARKGASFAFGPVDLTGPPATIVPVGFTLTRSDGTTYTTTAAVTLNGAGAAVAYATCAITGAAGNAVYGSPLTCGLGLTAAVASRGIGAGADVEDDEFYRSRILFRKRYVPMGGSRADYIAWTLAVPGITRAFVDDTSTGCSAGRVTVYPMVDITQAANYGLPTASDVAAVQAYLNTVAPIGSNATAAAASAFPVDVIVTKSLGVTALRRQAAADELYAAIRRTAAVSTASAPSLVTLTLLWSAIVQASGDSSIELGSPVADLAVPSGQIAVLRNVTFT